jgi:galactokinase
MIDIESLQAEFTQRYGVRPRQIVRAPGRVNLIGEHTDYNDGFVFPIALDRATFVAARARPDRSVNVYTRQFDGHDSFELDVIERSADKPWANYVRGVAKGLVVAGHELQGADMLIDSDVPLGAGLSSSAALEVAVGYTLQLLNDLNLLGEELALLAQGAENKFVGVQCGIMDQLISALGQADHALLIDCRDLNVRPVPMPPSARVVVCESGVHHQLGDSGYNERRAQCDEAVALLKAELPKITALRDVTLADLERFRHRLPPVVLQRARHVVSENSRVLESARALEHGDLVRFGQLMDASHRSMRDDYQISVPEIDLLVELAQSFSGCHGSRLTGGGFGGSTVSLVDQERVEAFVQHVAEGYRTRGGREARIFVCRASDGVRRVVSDIA